MRKITVDGFVFERCGNQYPNRFWTVRSNQQAGAVGTRCGKFWIIKNNIIRFANGVGIDWGNEGGSKQDLELGKNGLAKGSYGHKIFNNIICDNGAAGTAAFMANSFEFTKNLVDVITIYILQENSVGKVQVLRYINQRSQKLAQIL